MTVTTKTNHTDLIVEMLKSGRAVEAEAWCREQGVDKPEYLEWYLVEWALGRLAPALYAKERMAAVMGLKIRPTELVPMAPEPGPESFPAISLFVMPKSGSTYLSRLIQEAVGWPEAEANPMNDFTGVGYDAAMMLASLSRKAIVRSHAVASVRVRAMLATTGCRPVVLVRDIFDALESMVDHWGQRNSNAIGVPTNYQQWSREDQRELVIARFAAYYVDFHATWAHYASVNRTPMIEYQQLLAQPAAAVELCLETANLRNVSAERIERAVAKVEDRRQRTPESVRYNKGLAGRGREFTDGQRARVRALYRQYPRVNFKAIDSGWSS